MAKKKVDATEVVKKTTKKVVVDATKEVKAAPKAKKAKKEKAPRVVLEKKNGMIMPGVGTKTRSVWDTASKLSDKKKSPATRKEVVEACVAAGTNKSTANTQYGKWRKFYGLAPEPRAKKVVEEQKEDVAEA